MAELVPSFILTQTDSRGRFPAAGLRVDVSGFTAATSALMAHGSEAAEAIADIMDAIFAPLVDAVRENGGFITSFSGDAFTAVFPALAEAPALVCRRADDAATVMRDHLAAHPTHATRFGEFDFSARFGIGWGEVGWGIFDRVDQPGEAGAVSAVWYFRGSAIEEAVRSEAGAPAGQIVYAPHFRRGLELRAAPPATEHAAPLHPPADPGRFVPTAILERGGRGDFRQVVSVFIRLIDPPTHDALADFVAVVFELQERYGGYLNKIEFADKGCTLLLFWGAPTSRENDLPSALDFLLELRARSRLPLAVGVTYRHVYAGLIGAAERAEYTCYGEGVNLAARLMSAAPPGAFWLDAAAARRAAGFQLESRGEHLLKGFQDRVPVQELVGRSASADGKLFEGEMIGRVEERERIAEFVAPLLLPRAGWAAILEIVGEAGLGKSRLVHEALGDPAIAARAQVVTTQTDQLLRRSFNPFSHWLRRYFDQSPERSEAENRGAFDARLDVLIANTADESLRGELDRLRSVLAALVDLFEDGSLYAQLEPRGRHENTLIALQQLLRAEALRRPLILVLEDTHWLDDASREALAEIARNLAAVPIAILALTRPVAAATSALAEVPHQTLELGPLSPDELDALALSILGEPAGPALARLLTARAEGNPFFAEQIVRYLREEGAIERRNGEWELVAGAPAGVLPDDLRLLFIARLDRLAAALKETVQAAAILGREFETKALSAMLRGEADIDRHLLEGDRESIWSAIGQITYLFRHALLHTAAYEMQLVARRRALHRLAGEALESLYRDQPTPHLAEIAHHFETAHRLGIEELREPAVRYLSRAGDAQASRFENGAAIDSFTRALALAEAGQSSFEVLLKREAVLHLVGDREAQASDLDRLAELASRRPPRDAAMVLLRRARHATALADYPSAAAAADAATDLARAENDLALQGEARSASAEIHRLRGDAARAREIYAEALSLAREGGQVVLEAAALTGMGASAEYLSDYPGALAAYEEALLIARARGLRRLEGEILHDLGTISHRIADLGAAIRYFDEAMAIRRATGDRAGEAATLRSRAIVAHIQKDYALCLQLLDRSLALSLAIHDRHGEASAHRLIAMANNRIGHFDRAKEHFGTSLTLSREIGDLRGISSSLMNMGNHAALHGMLEEARDHFQRAIEVMEEIGDLNGQGNCYQNLGWIARTLGNHEEVPPLVERALSIRAEIGDRRGEGFALVILAGAMVGMHRWGDAELAVERGLAIAREIDETPLLFDLHAHSALVHLGRGDPRQAVDTIAPILEAMGEAYRLGGDPLDLYLACCRVLRAAGDPRFGAAIEAAYRTVRETAANIRDEEVRRGYLRNLPWTREIVAMWEGR